LNLEGALAPPLPLGSPPESIFQRKSFGESLPLSVKTPRFICGLEKRAFNW